MAGFVSYVPRASKVHALHPATKAVWFAAVAGCAILFAEPWTLACLLAADLGVLGVAGVLAESWRMLRRGVLQIALMIGLIQGLFYPGATNVLVALGPLAVKEEGVVFALVTILRLLVFICGFLPLVLATHPNALVAALEERGASPKVSYVVLATIQLIPLMQARAAAIVDAQRARAMPVGGNLVVRFRSLLALLSPLLLGSLQDVEQRALALEARGMMLPVRKVRLRQITDSPLDRRLRAGLGLLLLAVVVVRMWLWTSNSVA
jgi:energy-coupling factor transport system permease protein